MATVHITLTDTATGGVEVHTDFVPGIGAPCTKAQSAALEIFNRTRREWKLSGIEAVHITSPAMGTLRDLTQGGAA